MLPMAQPNELEPPRTERELIVAVDVAHVAGELFDVGAGAQFTIGFDALVPKVHRVPVGRVAKDEVADG